MSKYLVSRYIRLTVYFLEFPLQNQQRSLLKGLLNVTQIELDFYCTSHSQRRQQGHLA